MDWRQFRGATCLPECWCESPRVGAWILEPVNTWTNLAFVFIGLYFYFASGKLTIHKNVLSSSTFYPRTYGIAYIVMGIGSFFYHASQTFIGQWIDVMGMYLVSVFYITYNFVRSNHLRQNQFLYFYLITTAILGVVIYFFPDSRRYLFAVTIVFTFVQSHWLHKKLQTFINIKLLYLSLFIYGVAQGIWLLDKHRIWCDPYGWVNGHGIWHILTGISAMIAYYFFQSERIIKSEAKHL